MKRKWEEPRIMVQQFTPNEYVAACYHGVCNITGYVFNDSDGDGKYEPGTDRYNYYNTACYHDYWIEGQDAELPPQNAFVFSEIHRNNNGTLLNPFDDYYEGVGDPIPAWNFDRTHTTTSMDLENRPNHS